MFKTKNLSPQQLSAFTALILSVPIAIGILDTAARLADSADFIRGDLYRKLFADPLYAGVFYLPEDQAHL
jgi:hypothetical protein